MGQVAESPLRVVKRKPRTSASLEHDRRQRVESRDTFLSVNNRPLPVIRIASGCDAKRTLNYLPAGSPTRIPSFRPHNS